MFWTQLAPELVVGIVLKQYQEPIGESLKGPNGEK